MSEQKVLITGSTDGIGKQTALELAQNGFKVIIHGRNRKKALNVKEHIMKKSKNDNISMIISDLSSLEQIGRMVDELREKHDDLSILINNAGVYQTSKQLNDRGYEMTFMVNYLAPFALTIPLVPLLKRNAPSKIINVSSQVQTTSIDFENLHAEKQFNSYSAYGTSKTSLILFTYKLSKLLENENISVNCLHPGVISTKLLHQAFSGGAPVSRGAETPVYLASSPEVSNVTGEYFVNKGVSQSVPITRDEDVQDKLWNISEELTGIDSGQYFK